MIHKHDWLKTLLRNSPKAEFANQYFEALVEQIQLDAMQEGMRRAINTMYQQYYDHPGCLDRDVETAILTAANTLTIKDL